MSPNQIIIRNTKIHWFLCLSLFLSFLPGCISGQNLEFDYLDGENAVSFPFEYKNNFIVVNARLNNVLNVNLIFDTGAQHSLIFKKLYTDLLGAQYDRSISVLGSDMSQKLTAYVTRKININLMEKISFEKDLLVLEEDYFKLDEITGTRIDGLLGGETFKHFVVHIDYRKHLITLIRKSSFNKPRSKFDQVDIEVIESKPYLASNLHIKANESIPIKLLMDTGAGVPLLIYTNTHPDLRLPEKTIIGKLGKGLGGFLEGYLGKINSANIGASNFQNVITSFQELDSLGLINHTRDFRNGLVGNQIWSRFEIYIDYPGSKLYLKKEKDFDKEFEYDRSGLTVLAVGHELKDYLINSVLENSPAEEADLRQGDKIKKVRGVPTFFFTLSDVIRIFQKKPGKKIKLVIERNGVKLKKQMILRDLL